MKIAVTASGETLDSAVDPRFGRAPFFLVYDPDTGGHEVVDNGQNFVRPQGAGVQAAGCVSRAGAEYVITGHCGPKAFQALQRSGIVVLQVTGGTVREALDAFGRGELSPSSSPDVQGHW